MSTPRNRLGVDRALREAPEVEQAPHVNGHPTEDEVAAGFSGSTAERAVVYPNQAPRPPWGDGPHPLDNYIPHTPTITPIEFVVDDVLASGLAMLAGLAGVGKTEGIVSLMRYAAWFCRADDPMRPLLRRHIVYVCEDPAQVHRVLHAVRLALANDGVALSEAIINEWFHVVSAVAMPVEEVIQVARVWADKFTTTSNKRIDGLVYPAKPVVVIDTKSALFRMDDENANAENSRILSAVRTGMEGLPVLILAHLPKVELNRKNFDPFQLTPRGASSQLGDVQQALAFVFDTEDRETGARYLLLGKRRFETHIKELQFTRRTFSVESTDVLGNTKRITIACSDVVAHTAQTLSTVTTSSKLSGPSMEGVANQVWNLINSELAQGRRYSQNMLKPVASEAGIGRNELAAAVAMLIAEGRVAYWRRPDWRGANPADQNYLHPIGTTAPRDTWGEPVPPKTKAKR
ncbi:AAA family ATPase [Variovorax sp. OV329]|uniref:AAA family ATPase n=1 Tax=Variovorax sp. OV329 TaxID=1882825 RepID=UPI0008DF7C11|nr:AAA family ATPase [Variovorax sp. OV329]SFL87404.1 AAA domain-containing protein [Variovorax sp. OV329]